MNLLNRKSFRSRRIDQKKAMKIFWEHEAQDIDEYATQARSAPPIETGVEKEEEEELHLQAVLNATAVALTTGNLDEIKTSIPIPEAKREVPEYEDLYKDKNWSEPSTYVKFSEEIEDSTGCPYTLTDEDLDWIANYNSSATVKLEEDELEWILYQMELIANRRLRCKKDISALPTMEDLERTFTDERLKALRQKVKCVYPYWKECRVKKNGGAMQPIVMTEPVTPAEDNNPYVCFRRRELKPTRKTRRSDAKSFEKCDLLYKNLGVAELVLLKCMKREKRKHDFIAGESKTFEAKRKMKDLSRELGLGLEEQPGKRPRKKLRKTSHSSLDASRKGQLLKAEATQIADAQAGRIDATDEIFEAFRKPPPIEYFEVCYSDDDETSEDDEPLSPLPQRCAFRTRIGRGGRLFIDRRGFRSRDSERRIFLGRFNYDDLDESEIFGDDLSADTVDESPIRFSLLKDKDISDLNPRYTYSSHHASIATSPSAPSSSSSALQKNLATVQLQNSNTQILRTGGVPNGLSHRPSSQTGMGQRLNAQAQAQIRPPPTMAMRLGGAFPQAQANSPAIGGMVGMVGTSGVPSVRSVPMTVSMMNPAAPRINQAVVMSQQQRQQMATMSLSQMPQRSKAPQRVVISGVSPIPNNGYHLGQQQQSQMQTPRVALTAAHQQMLIRPQLRGANLVLPGNAQMLTPPNGGYSNNPGSMGQNRPL